MDQPPGPPPPPPDGPPTPASSRQGGDEVVLFKAVPAATPLVWLRWLITLGIYEIFRRRTQFIVTNHRVILRHGLIERSERSLPLNRIQDINTRRGLLTGAVLLTSAGGGAGVESMGPMWNGTVRRMADTITQQVA